MPVIVEIQRRHFKKTGAIFNQYQIDILNPNLGKLFIIKNKRLIINLYGKNLLREFIINYRSRYGTKNIDKLYRDFVKYVKLKNVKHKSDIAISYNILKNFNLTADQETVIIEFVIDRLGDRISKPFKETSLLKFQKLFLINKIRELGIVKQ